MSKYFIPFKESKPAVIDIKGHKLIFVSESKDMLDGSLELVGANNIKQFDMCFSEEDLVLSMEDDLPRVGFVFTPPEMSLHDVLFNLHDDLPWLH